MDLTITALEKRYDDFSLHIDDLSVGVGEVVGLVGNNGAGKTTLLRLVLNLIRADAGQVAIGGHDVRTASAWKADTGSYLGPSFLIDFLTPGEYWRFVGQTYGLTAAEVRTRLEAFTSFFTDEPIAETTTYIRELSTGNQNKVGLIGALLHRPRLLLLDEPFASLDPGSQLWLKRHLQRLRGTGEVTMIVSSHDLGHVTDVSTRIALLEAGRLVREVPTAPDTLATLRAYFEDARASGAQSAEEQPDAR
ncbi:MAG: ATP-binding cassette domain-containing protein [Bacteroidota bacterium]